MVRVFWLRLGTMILIGFGFGLGGGVALGVLTSFPRLGTIILMYLHLGGEVIMAFFIRHHLMILNLFSPGS